MSRIVTAFMVGVLGAIATGPAGASPGGFPALNPSRPIAHLAPGTRVLTRIDANSASEFAIVWTETSGQDGDLSGVFMSRDGGTEESVNLTTIGQQESADVSIYEDASVIAAWANNGSEVRFRSFDPAGGGGGAEVSAFNGRSPGVDHYKDGSFIVVGIDAVNDVRAQRYHADGTPNGGLLTVSSVVPAGLVRVEVAADSTVCIVWSNPPGTIIQARIIDSAGLPIGPDFQVGLSANPVDGLDIDHGGGGFHIIWGFPGQVMTRVVKEDGSFSAPQQNVFVGNGPYGITDLTSGALGLFGEAPFDISGRCIDDLGFPNGARSILDDLPMANHGSLDFDGTHLHVAYVSPAGIVRIGSSLALTVSVGPGSAPQTQHRAVPTAFTSTTRIEFDHASHVGRSRVAVLDLAGRLVRELPVECAGEACGVTWDGTDESGRGVAPGVYFYRIAGVGGGRVVRL